MSGGDWKEMFRAAKIGDFNLAEFYLKLGVDPNYQHPEYMAAALVESIRFNHFNITKLLLEYGANPLIEEILEGDTPTSVAQAKKNTEVLDLLKVYIDKLT
ncbi:MAG: ankyrin repeat protein [Maribacter sp.]|jgi:ankyrin repeat protein